MRWHSIFQGSTALRTSVAAGVIRGDDWSKMQVSLHTRGASVCPQPPLFLTATQHLPLRPHSRGLEPFCVTKQDTTDLRVLSRAYMEMLRDLSPPLNAGSRWSATRERIRGDQRFQVSY